MPATSERPEHGHLCGRDDCCPDHHSEAGPVTVNDEGDVVLSDPAVRALAERLVAAHLTEGGWLEWEDVPALAEGTFTALAEEADRIAADMWRVLKAHDQRSGIDSAYLLEVAQDEPLSGRSKP